MSACAWLLWFGHFSLWWLDGSQYNIFIYVVQLTWYALYLTTCIIYFFSCASHIIFAYSHTLLLFFISLYKSLWLDRITMLHSICLQLSSFYISFFSIHISFLRFPFCFAIFSFRFYTHSFVGRGGGSDSKEHHASLYMPTAF